MSGHFIFVISYNYAPNYKLRALLAFTEVSNIFNVYFLTVEYVIVETMYTHYFQRNSSPQPGPDPNDERL
jgi:hypothetical protein